MEVYRLLKINAARERENTITRADSFTSLLTTQNSVVSRIVRMQAATCIAEGRLLNEFENTLCFRIGTYYPIIMKKNKIEIQCCTDCHQHFWSTRHNVLLYQRYFKQLLILLRQHFPNFPVELTPEPRVGAFELKFNGDVIYSKLKSGRWPSLTKLMQMIRVRKFMGASRSISQPRKTNLRKINISKVRVAFCRPSLEPVTVQFITEASVFKVSINDRAINQLIIRSDQQLQIRVKKSQREVGLCIVKRPKLLGNGREQYEVEEKGKLSGIVSFKFREVVDWKQKNLIQEINQVVSQKLIALSKNSGGGTFPVRSKHSTLKSLVSCLSQDQVHESKSYEEDQQPEDDLRYSSSTRRLQGGMLNSLV